MSLPNFESAMAAVGHGPSAAYTTFQAVAPPRPATCEEYGCPYYLNGWRSSVAAEFVEHYRSLLIQNRFEFTEEQGEDGRIDFVFPPGQRCFRRDEHVMRNEFRERLFQRGGDWRGNPRGDVREFTRGDDWIDAFANNQIKVTERLERG